MYLHFVAGGARRPGPGQQRQNMHHRGAPSLHHPERRPHRRLPGRRGGGAGDASAAAGKEGSLPHAGHHTAGPQD